MYGESFLEEIAFHQQLVFFFDCFQSKYSQNLLGSKYDLTLVTFNLWTDTQQFSAP